MVKKLKDLSQKNSSATINLKRSNSQPGIRKKVFILKKGKNKIYKNAVIKELNDLSAIDKSHFLYIKGKNFKTPKYLGNLLKIAFLGFLVVFLINSVNVYYTGKKIEKQLTSEAYQGYDFLISGGKNATQIEFDQAIASFERAQKIFGLAKENLWFISTDHSYYAKKQSVPHAVDVLLDAGKNLANSGNYFSQAIESFNKIPLYFVSKNSASDSDSQSITEILKIGLQKTSQAISEINDAQNKIATIDEANLPSEIASKVKFAKAQIIEISNTLNSISEHFPAFLKLLGDRYPHRYLILMQNNNEIRPTGGFIGSYAIVDLNDGYIDRLSVHDVYDIDNFYGELIEPPEELKSFTGNWRFRDSNYSPDFSISAAKARWFLQKEGGPTVDTVIALNQGLLKDLLEITGPVQVGSFGQLDSENYSLLLSFIIEGKIWGPEDPKHILKVFIPAFKKALLKKENLAKILIKLYKAIAQKHILFYSSDQEIQALFESLGASGTVYQNTENEDYLSVINTAYGGTKSEQFIEEQIAHDTFINQSGQLIDTLSMKRSHKWTDDVYFQWKKILQKYGFKDMPDSIIDILGRGPNKVNIRIYVPAQSALLKTNDTKLQTKYDKELKKTYFFTTMEVNQGETKELKIEYRLPFSLKFENTTDTYKLVVEKQPGSRGSIFDKTIHSADKIYNLGFYPHQAKLDTLGKITYATNLVYDRNFTSLWSK